MTEKLGQEDNLGEELTDGWMNTWVHERWHFRAERI